MIAFQVNDFLSLQQKDNEQFVRWEAFIIENNGVSDYQRTEIGVHRCQNEDFNKFYDVSSASESRVNYLKKEGSLWCLDTHDEAG